MNNVKKHVLSLLLTVALIAGIIYPALQIGAKAINEKVILSATAVDNIAIKKSDKLPETDDYDGVLSLSTGTFEIERDYAQKATVTVTNTGENNIEYYLVVQNIYKDIYMNFVRNGSAASPLVIKPGEKQSVQLDIFAQNAEQEEYYLPIYAMIIKGDSEVEDAKSTITLKCPGINLDLSLNLISEDPYSLAKTYKLYNNGETLTDVTVAVEGEAKDYIAVDPIIENYQLNKRNSVSFNATPDLSKMKENNLTTIDGQLVVSAGGKSRSFDLLFDTQGKEITSISMGALALIQNGNMYANMIVVDGSDNVEATQNNDGFTFKKEIQFAYGDNYSQKLSTTLEIEGKKCAEEAEESSVINYISKGKYVAKSHRTLTQDEYSNEVFIIKTSAIYSSKTILKTIEDYYDENSMYQMDFILTIDDGCSKNIEESEKSLSDLTYYAIGNSASSYLSNPELSKSDRTAYSVAEIFSLLMTCHNSDFEINQEDDTSFDFLDDAIFSKPTVFDNNGLKGYQATITVDEDLSFDFFSDYLVVDDLEEGLNYIESESDGEKVYVADSIVFIIKDGKVFFSFYAFEDNSDGTYNRIRMGMEFASTDDIQTASYSDDIISTQNLVEESVKEISEEYLGFFKKLHSFSELLDENKKNEDYEYFVAKKAIEEAKKLVGDNDLELITIELKLSLAKMISDNEKIVNKISNEYIEKAFEFDDTKFPGKKSIEKSMKKCTAEMDNIIRKIRNESYRDVFEDLKANFNKLIERYNSLIEEYGKDEGVRIFLEERGYQCTNAGQITTKYQAPSFQNTHRSKGATDKTDQSAPSGLVGISENIYKQANGTITGVTTEMEYRMGGEIIYRVITDTELTNLAAGTYYIRYKADDNHNASPDTVIVLKNGKKLKVSLPEDQIGYTLTASETEISWNKSTTITFVLAPGYAKTDSFAVKVNGDIVALDDNGQFTVTNVQQNITVTVAGIAPFILGIDDGVTYYGDTSFAIADANIEKVTVDGNEVDLIDGKYTIIADGKEHIIVATDKFGNTNAEIKITVIAIESLDVNAATENVESSNKKAIEDVQPVANSFVNSEKTIITTAQSQAESAKTSSKAKTGGNEETVKMFVTGRMYAAADVNKFYGNPGPDYVDIAATQYSYTLNGYKVATSFNSGVTDVAIANIPTEHLKFGQSNTLVCDYLTNPGHYFVNTDTQISLIYPADTYISYIGSPETLNDIRSLPDFAIYSENIFGSSDDVVIGSKTEVSFNVYNRGSIGGWFDIEVKCGNNVAYTETNHYLDCFSGDNIVFEWIPEKETEDITVTLTNKSVGLDEKKTDNNSATRTFKARTRVVPSIESITPDYATEGEGIVFATVSNYADVIKAEFYVDDVLYKGEVKYSVVNNQMRCWINDSEMAEGNHIIKVVVTYATGSNSTATIEGSSSILVLNADWNKYEFVLDTSFSSPLFYIYNKKTQSYKQTYDVSRNGENCVLTLTKDMYDNLSDYVLFISCHNGFVHKNLSDKASTFDYESVNTLDFIGNENVCFVGIRYKSFDGNTIDVYGGNNSSVKLTPAKYNIEIEFTCFEESKTANLEIDLTNENKTVDLASLISKYTFKFADEINGTPLAKMFYRNTATENWNSFVLKQSLSENELMCVVSDYNIDAFNNASEAFILVTTNNSVFVADVKPETDPSEVILLDKSKVQKYSLDTGDKDFSYVKVDCERFSVNLYSSTIYIHPGEYDITINFGGENENMEYCLYSQAVDYETADVTIDWSKAYKEKDAYVYAIGESGEKLSLESYEAGTSFEVKKDIYSVKTNITRNNSYYTVDSAVDASDEDCEIYIGSRFEGKITNTFETIDGGSTIRMYLDYLVDDNGNTLSYFNSKNEDDNLKGYVTFTDLSNKLNTYKVYVSLDNVSSFDVKIPDVDGTYSVSLEVMTENEIIRNVGEIELDVSNLSLSLNETYTLVATVYPENATNKNVTWASSNSDIVSVDKNGNITASKFSNGTVYVTATTEDGGYTATCSIEVKLTWWQKILKFILISPLFQYVMELIY